LLGNLDAEKVKAIASGMPQTQLWKKILGRLNEEDLRSFYKTVYSRGTFGSSPRDATTKRDLMIPILERAYELSPSPGILNSVFYSFREPWTRGWGGTLSEVVELMARHQDRHNLKEFASYMGLFDEAQINAWEMQFMTVIGAARDLKDGPTLQEMAKTAFKDHDRNPRVWSKSLRFLIDSAADLKDVAVLEKIGANAFQGSTAKERVPELNRFIDVCEELNAYSALGELARNLRPVNASVAEERLFEPPLLRLVEIARKRRNKTILEQLSYNVKDRTLSDSFYAKYSEAVQKTKLNSRAAECILTRLREREGLQGAQ
jgi:hypothetical protein